MRTKLCALAAVLLVAGCSQPAETPADTNQTEQPPAAPAVTPTKDAGVDLSPYEGKYPFDKVGGTDFLHQPAVIAAVQRSGAPDDVRRFILSADGPQTPIARRGTTLVAWGCEAHNCEPHNWSVLVGADGTGGEVCYHDQDAGEPPRWYADGKLTDKREGCD